MLHEPIEIIYDALYLNFIMITQINFKKYIPRTVHFSVLFPKFSPYFAFIVIVPTLKILKLSDISL